MHQKRSAAEPGRSSSLLYGTARLLSDAINPLFIPPAVLVLVGWMTQAPSDVLMWTTGIAFIFYTAVPLSIARHLLSKGFITTLDVPQQSNRDRLFLYSILSSTAGSLLLIYLLQFLYPLLAITAWIFLVHPFCGYLINLKWKISIHTAAISTAGTILLSFSVMYGALLHISYLEIFYLFGLLVVLILMTWARYYLNIHSVTELIGGTCAGVILTLVELHVLIRIW